MNESSTVSKDLQILSESFDLCEQAEQRRIVQLAFEFRHVAPVEARLLVASALRQPSEEVVCEAVNLIASDIRGISATLVIELLDAATRGFMKNVIEPPDALAGRIVLQTDDLAAARRQLLTALAHQKAQVREEAAAIFIELPPRDDAIEQLALLLNDPEIRVRAVAAVTLATWGAASKPIVLGLIDALKIRYRREVAGLLTNMMPDSLIAIPAIVQASQDLHLFDSCAQALCKMSADQTFNSAVIARGLDEEPLRFAAVSNLMRCGAPGIWQINRFLSVAAPDAKRQVLDLLKEFPPIH